MMDTLTGLVWDHKKHYENAETMFKRAIADISHTAFPKDCTASLRYDSLPDAYQKQQELIRRLKAKEV